MTASQRSDLRSGVSLFINASDTYDTINFRIILLYKLNYNKYNKKELIYDTLALCW